MTIIEPRTAVVPVYGGDYQDRLRHLDNQIEAALEAEKTGPPLTGDEVLRSTTLIEEYNELAQEAEAEATYVKLRALRRRTEWRPLADAHPPRTSEEVPESKRRSDERLGVNETTFREVLVPAAIVELTNGDGTRQWSDLTQVERDEFLDIIADADFEALFINAYGLVNSFSSSPKVHVSPLTPRNGETPN